MRYSDNPQIRYRDDLVAYGEVVIAVANYSTVITFSSEKALHALQTASMEYCMNNMVIGNPIPSLLDLLEIIAPGREVPQIRCKYENNGNSNPIAICKIVEI